MIQMMNAFDSVSNTFRLWVCLVIYLFPLLSFFFPVFNTPPLFFLPLFSYKYNQTKITFTWSPAVICYIGKRCLSGVFFYWLRNTIMRDALARLVHRSVLLYLRLLSNRFDLQFYPLSKRGFQSMNVCPYHSNSLEFWIFFDIIVFVVGWDVGAIRGGVPWLVEMVSMLKPQ